MLNVSKLSSGDWINIFTALSEADDSSDSMLHTYQCVEELLLDEGIILLIDGDENDMSCL